MANDILIKLFTMTEQNKETKVKSIKREIPFTTIEVGRMKMVDGEIKSELLSPITIQANLNLTTATRVAKEKYGQDVSVLTVKKLRKTFEATLVDFMEIAEVIETKEVQ